MDNLFEEFENISKKEWVAKIEKDLKGIAIESLIKDYDGIIMNPILTVEDLPKDKKNVPIFKSDNDWWIGTSIIVEDEKEANKTLLAMLMQGVESPNFIFLNKLNAADFEALFEGVALEIIQPFFDLNEENTAALLDYFAVQYKHKTRSMRGAIFSTSNQSAKIHAVLPCFFTQKIENDAANDLEEVKALYQQLDAVLDLGINTRTLVIDIKIGTNYLLQIAKLRAVRILIAHLLEKHQIAATPIFINAKTDVRKYGDDTNQNRIINSIQAMSAVAGGIDRLEICPASDDNLSERTAINIHHLMKMENYLDKVIDPANGSYLIENLTNQFVELSLVFGV
jgi:methylmalonyl-CoA mutase